MATTTIIISALVLLVGALVAVIIRLWPHRPRKKPTVKYQPWEYPIINRVQLPEKRNGVKPRRLIERIKPYAIVAGIIGTLVFQGITLYLDLSTGRSDTHEMKGTKPEALDSTIHKLERKPLADSTNLAILEAYVPKSTGQFE